MNDRPYQFDAHRHTRAASTGVSVLLIIALMLTARAAVLGSGPGIPVGAPGSSQPLHEQPRDPGREQATVRHLTDTLAKAARQFRKHAGDRHEPSAFDSITLHASGSWGVHVDREPAADAAGPRPLGSAATLRDALLSLPPPACA